MTFPRPVVIDASVALALLLDAPEARTIAEVFRRFVSEGQPRLVPSLFWLEVLNRLRREPGTSGAEMLDAVHRLDTYDIETIDPGRTALVQVIDRVERHGLSPYDATYLVLAEEFDADLATMDRALAAAAGSRAIGLDGARRTNEARVDYERDVTWPRYKEASAYLAKLRAATLAGRSASPHER